jgi:hypothetical protein
MWDRIEKCTHFVGSARRKRPFGTIRRFEDGMSMDIRDIRWGWRVHSFGSGWGPVTGPCEYDDKPSCPCVTDLVTFLVALVV